MQETPFGGLLFIHIFSVKKFWKSEAEVICMLQMFNALVSPPFEGGVALLVGF